MEHYATKPNARTKLLDIEKGKENNSDNNQKNRIDWKYVWAEVK